LKGARSGKSPAPRDPGVQKREAVCVEVRYDSNF
jgi:hypothetical protein